MHWFFLLLFGLLPSGCEIPVSPPAPSKTASGQVQFEMASGQAAIVVPVRINDSGPYRLVVDTGATLTCLDDDLVRKLKLPERKGVTGIGAGVRTGGRVKLVKIDSLQVGDASASGLPACAIDLRNLEAIGLEADGLLGLNFLRDYRVTFDFDRKLLSLDQPKMSGL